MIPDAIRDGDDTIPCAQPAYIPTGHGVARRGGVDLILLGAILALVAIGTVEIYSASAVFAATKNGSSTYFLARQLAYVSMGLVLLFWAVGTDFGWLRRHVHLLLLFAFVLLVGVLIFGARINNARRWFVLGPLSFQPVEIAKLALVIYLSDSLTRKQEKVKTFTVGFLPHLAVCGAMMLLLLMQPDLGSSLILGGSTLLLLFIAGTKVSYILIAILGAAPILYHAIVGTPWRLRRLIAFVDPWQFREGVGYQITESLISLGSGGLTGLGLGDGKQKLFYMPEAHSDFIMSNIGEELGLVGVGLVLILFAIILWRGVKIAVGARDLFGTYLTVGLTSIFALQALVNTAVVLGAIPAKGLTLPFVSYGGTSLLMSFVNAGILLNISTRQPAPASTSRWRLENVITRNRRKKRHVRVLVE